MRVASPPVMVTVTLSSFTETEAFGLSTSALLSFFGSSGVDAVSASAAGAAAEPSMAAQSMAAMLLLSLNACINISLHIQSRERPVHSFLILSRFPRRCNRKPRPRAGKTLLTI